jgi:hypothetical protein
VEQPVKFELAVDSSNADEIQSLRNPELSRPRDRSLANFISDRVNHQTAAGGYKTFSEHPEIPSAAAPDLS